MKINYKQFKYVQSYESSESGLINVIIGYKWWKMRQYKLTEKNSPQKFDLKIYEKNNDISKRNMGIHDLFHYLKENRK